jgi:hypothetical protein
MSKPKMLAAEQPPETETEAAADAAARDALVVETAAPPVPEGEAPAEAKQADAMAAAWAARRAASEAPAAAVGATGAPWVPPGYKLVQIVDVPNHSHMSGPPGVVMVSDAAPMGHHMARHGGTMVFDDHQAAADDGLTPITVRLKPSTAQYLTDRAAMFGETPPDHLARILREFRLTDTQRPDLARLPGNEVGMPALARPR